MKAVITGASKGIGLAVAQALVANGHTVYCLSRTAPPPISEGTIQHIYCDISNHESISTAFSQLFRLEPYIDVLINNAGIGIAGTVEHASVEDLKKIIDVNFYGSVWATQQVLPLMRDKRMGKIIFISSMGSIFTLPFQTLYSATKNAINSLAEGLRLELKPYNIQVCSLLLGDINSEFTSNRETNNKCDGYGNRLKNSLAVMEKDERNGMSCAYIGKKIAHYIAKKHLAPYKIIGFQYKAFYLLNKILPKKAVLYITYKMYGGEK